MAAWIPLLYDIALVAIVIYFAAACARKGFLKTVVLLGGSLLSIFVAGAASAALSKVIFDNFIRTGITNTIVEKVPELSSGALSAESIQSILQSMPGFAQDFVRGGLSSLDGLVADNAAQLAQKITDTVVAPVVTALVQGILFFVLLILCGFVVRFVAGLFGGLYRIPILGGINTFLGGVLGVFQGGLMAYLLTCIVFLVILISGGSLSFMNQSVVESTFLFKHLYNLNIFNILFPAAMI